MIGNKTAQHVRMGTLLHVGMVSSYPMEREKKEYIGAHAKQVGEGCQGSSIQPLLINFAGKNHHLRYRQKWDFRMSEEDVKLSFREQT